MLPSIWEKHHPGVPSAGSRTGSSRQLQLPPLQGYQEASRAFQLAGGFLALPRLGGHASLLVSMKKAVSRKSWLVLQNLIVTGMRNSKRVTLRKAHLLNGSLPLPSEPCHYSVMLLHGTQKVTSGALCFSHLQDAS